MNSLPVGILLAAGSSSRFGDNKLLHCIIDNTPMLFTSAQKLASTLPGSIVVIHHALTPYIGQLEQMGLHVVINEEAEQGMGTSIACGVSASEDASGWLIMLADMPYIKHETISTLACKLKDSAHIIAPEFNQQRGHPVVFSQHYKTALLALNKDNGARDIIRQHQSELELVVTDDSGVVIDVDKPGDVV